MSILEIKQQTPDAVFPFAEKASLLKHFHTTLKGAERTLFSSVRVNGNNTLEASFKGTPASLRIGENVCSIVGDVTKKRADLVTKLAASCGYKDISLNGTLELVQSAWLVAQDYNLNVQNVNPISETLGKYVKQAEMLQTLEPFLMNAKKFNVHFGSMPTNKPSMAEKFLKTFAEKTGKIAQACKPVTDFLKKNKTVVNIAGMGLGFVIMGPVGTTLYSQIDKARRANEEAARRRKEEKERLVKIASFIEKGIIPPKSLENKKKFYKERPYIRFTGHLTTRLAGTVALTALAGPVVGVACSAMITVGKAVWDTHLIQDGIRKILGKKITNHEKMSDRILNAAQTGIGVEIEKEKIKKIAKKLNPLALIKSKKESLKG